MVAIFDMGMLSIILKERNIQRFANVAFDRTVMIFMEFVIVALFAMQLDHCNIQRVFGQRQEPPLFHIHKLCILMPQNCIRSGKSSKLYAICIYNVFKFRGTRLKETIHKAFSHRNYGSKCVVLGYNSTYFSNKIQRGKTCYSEEQVISMLEFLIDNIFVSFGGTLFQQVVGIPMGYINMSSVTISYRYNHQHL